MTPVKMAALADMRRKQSELAGGASALTLQPGGRQASLGAAKPGDLGAASLDLFGDGLEKIRPRGAGGVAVGRKRAFRGPRGAVHFLCATRRKTERRPGHRLRVKTVVGPDPIACDQMLAFVFIGHLVVLTFPSAARSRRFRPPVAAAGRASGPSSV